MLKSLNKWTSLGILLCAFAAGLCGCNAYVIDGKKVSEAHLTPQQKVQFLRTEASKRHLNWKIYCVPGAWKSYQGDARPESEPEGATYIEDGAKDFWIGTGDTPEDAALDLAKEIVTHPANFSPGHKPNFDSDANGDCAYKTVLDSTKTEPIHCKEGK